MRRVAFFLVGWLLISALSTLWALGSAPGSSPDEPAHAIKAASVARGEFVGVHTPEGHRVHVPAYVGFLHAQTCYAYNDEQSAACMPEPPADPGALVESTTTAGLYNPVYYLAVGWPTLLFGDEAGVYAMRIVSGALTAAFLSCSLALVSTWRRPLLPVVGVLVAATPMVLFLGGSVNPNALETSATLAVFVAMLSLVRHPDRTLLVERSVALAVAAAVAANARGISLLWLALAVLVPLVLLGREQLVGLLKERAIQLAIGATVLTSGFAAVWVLTSGSLDGGYGNEVPYAGSPAWLGFAIVLQNTFEYGQGMVGVFGWLDTPAPVGVFFVWAGAIGALAIAGAVVLRGRALIVSLLLVAGVVLVPPLVQAAFIGSGGYIWQGRYALPVFACLLVGAIALVAEEIPRHAEFPVAVLVSIGWAAGQLGAFATALRRYVTGLDGSWVDMVTTPEWQPPGGALLLIGLFAVAAAAVGLLPFAVTRWGGSADPDETGPDTDQGERMSRSTSRSPRLA